MSYNSIAAEYAPYIALYRVRLKISPKDFYARRYAERDYATVYRPSVLPSVWPSVCDVQVPWSHTLEYFENNFTAN